MFTAYQMLPDPELLELVSFQNASPYEYACYFITKNSMSEFATDQCQQNMCSQRIQTEKVAAFYQ